MMTTYYDSKGALDCISRENPATVYSMFFEHLVESEWLIEAANQKMENYNAYNDGPEKIEMEICSTEDAKAFLTQHLPETELLDFLETYAPDAAVTRFADFLHEQAAPTYGSP